MKSKRVGIIAENISDVITIKVLIERISGNSVPIERYVGRGGGRIISRCKTWADSLHQRKCDTLIIIHDSDHYSATVIRAKISQKLNGSPFQRCLICIPIQELEAWLLSDPVGLKNAMNLKIVPKIKASPQDIPSPKEYLEKIIKKASLGKRNYINTEHNHVIATKISIREIHKKCDAFRPFHQFVKDYIS